MITNSRLLRRLPTIRKYFYIIDLLYYWLHTPNLFWYLYISLAWWCSGTPSMY